jgi:hypothetical protein
MAQYLSSRTVEKAVDITGTHLRRLVRQGVINPQRDSSGRILYTQAHVDALIEYRLAIFNRRQPREGAS